MRWLALLNPQNHGILIKGVNPLNFSVWPFTQQDLIIAQHTDEFPQRSNLTLNVRSNPTRAFERKPLVPQKYEYTFHLRGYYPELGTLQEVADWLFLKNKKIICLKVGR